jgi:hypothetical protein
MTVVKDITLFQWRPRTPCHNTCHNIVASLRHCTLAKTLSKLYSRHAHTHTFPLIFQKHRMSGSKVQIQHVCPNRSLSPSSRILPRTQKTNLRLRIARDYRPQTQRVKQAGLPDCRYHHWVTFPCMARVVWSELNARKSFVKRRKQLWTK